MSSQQLYIQNTATPHDFQLQNRGNCRKKWHGYAEKIEKKMRYIIRRRYVSHAIAMFAFSFEKPQFVFIFCIFRRFLNLNICKKTRNTFCGTRYLPRSQVHNERTVPVIMAGCITHARNGRISTSGLKSDVTIVFLDPDFFKDVKISAIRVHLRQIGLFIICMGFQDILA